MDIESFVFWIETEDYCDYIKDGIHQFLYNWIYMFWKVDLA